MRVSTAESYEFSVEEYHTLGEVGIFHEDDRVELLNGQIILMSPIGYRHMNAVRRMNKLFNRRFGERCEVDVQNPVMIDGKSEPQPDILLLRDTVYSRKSPPLPEDVLLLVEVADSSLQYDRTDKRDAYARSGIVEYWLLDLTRNELQVFRNGDGHSYHAHQCLGMDESIAPLAFPDTPVTVRDLLPP
ncbi:MAG TPA: Uma2 family endonuclease [Chthoniobacteraceae bacterium]|jgi:Uma2 family endonuclease